MKADPKIAQSIGSRLVLYKDSLAKQRVDVLDFENLQEILNDTSPDLLAAEQELVMAWRFYTQEREQQIACGEFRFCSSPDEIEAAWRFLRAREIVFDPANIKGVVRVKSQIATAIEQDVLMDATKWQAVEAHDIERKIRIREMYCYGATTVPIPLETLDPLREKFVEGNLLWCKSKEEDRFRKYYGHRIDNAIREMLEEHRDYWAQRPTQPYDDSALNYIFTFSIYGGNYGLGSLFCAWDRYLERRISDCKPPFETCTDEERAVDKEERRNRPIEYPHSHPNAREIIESHIRSIIREDIVADIDKWKRHSKKVEAAKERSKELRLKRIEHHKNEFIAKVRNMFGQQVVEIISAEDIDRYSFGIVDRRESGQELWYSILKKYELDQITCSCLYFIRQGDAIKIGITDDLGRRFAQIKTSAAVACKIENVVYTHHGRKLERKLHQALARYNSHLEWFALPPTIKGILFAAKSADDIEDFLTQITRNEFNDGEIG